MKGGDTLTLNPQIPELPQGLPNRLDIIHSEKFVVPFGSLMGVEIPEDYIHSPPASAKINTALPEPDSQENDSEKK